MKKNYLVVLGILMFLLPLSVAAQQLVWENTFESAADLQGWALHDLDGNGNGWTQGKNWITVANVGTSVGTAEVLRYSITLGPNQSGYVPNVDKEDNWIISPAIDLTGASGVIQLAIDWQRQMSWSYGSGRIVYISTTPNLADFKQQQTNGIFDYYIFEMGQLPSDPNQFYQEVIDISTFAGQTIYIGLYSGTVDATYADMQNTNIGINEMAIYASELSGSPVSGVSLNKTTTSLVVGANETLTATVAPDDATNKEVTWSSSNEAVATVDATGKVTAVAAGTADITVTTTDGGKTAKCTVTVTAAIDYSWLKAAAIAVEGSSAKVVGPNAETFTLFYINNQPVTLTNGLADLTGKTGELSLKATTADASGVIKLKISK